MDQISSFMRAESDVGPDGPSWSLTLLSAAGSPMQSSGPWLAEGESQCRRDTASRSIPQPLFIINRPQMTACQETLGAHMATVLWTQ